MNESISPIPNAAPEPALDVPKKEWETPELNSISVERDTEIPKSAGLAETGTEAIVS